MTCLGIFMTQKGGTMLQTESPLEASSSLASCLLVLSMTPSLIPSWVGQILVIVAGNLGCNTIDWTLSYAVVIAHTCTGPGHWPATHLLLKFLFSASPWVWLACHMVFVLIRAVCLPLVASIAVYALLFPSSETSFKDNYDLRFLEPIARRALHPSEPITLSEPGPL